MDTGRLALSRGAQLATIVVPAAFLALFFAFPLAAILERGLTSTGGLSLPANTGELLWFTTWQAAASTVLTLVAGLPLAWAIGRFRFRGRSLVRALVLVPFVLPVRNGTPLPEAFEKYAVSPPSPLELPVEEIGDNRDRWIDEWTQVVLR